MRKTNSQKLKDVAREFHRGWPDRTIICCLGHRPETQFLQNIFVGKKCFHFVCPSLGVLNQDIIQNFGFTIINAIFCVATFRNLSDHKRFNLGTKIKILWLPQQENVSTTEIRFWSKNVKLQPNCRQAGTKLDYCQNIKISYHVVSCKSRLIRMRSN